MPLNAQILLSILAHETSSGDLSRTLRATPANYAMTLADGTGANQAQVVWSDRLTIQANGNADIQMRMLQDDRGSVSFTAIKAIYIKNNSATSDVYINQGGAVQNSWDSLGYSDSGESSIPVSPGGALFLSAPTAAGLPVTASADRLLFGGTPGETLEIVLIGEGAIS